MSSSGNVKEKESKNMSSSSSVSGNENGGVADEQNNTSVSGNVNGGVTNEQNNTSVSGNTNGGVIDEQNNSELVLQQFDMNMDYGPSIGMTRLARWERAKEWKKKPPQEIKELILKSGKQEGLWNNRV